MKLVHQYPGSVTLKCDQAGLSFGFSVSFFPFFFKRTSVALLKLWGVEDYTDLGTPCPRNLTIT